MSRLANLSVIATLFLASCAGSSPREQFHDLTKALERGAYDDAAKKLSLYCGNIVKQPLWIQRTRIEARREVRQSKKGRHGPPPPTNAIAGLDEKTANGRGPIIRIWCANEKVPDVVWKEDLVRDWKD